MYSKKYDISWEQFEQCNPDKRTAFEKMCRWLFNIFFFNGKAILHSDPNNPGIEVVPVLHSESGKRISFQAKYFDSIDYNQIKHSAEIAIKYYEGKLDIIYLYCNKDVNSTNENYKRIEKLLKDSNIELIPITNQSVLEQVMGNKLVASYFFDYVRLDVDWFKEQLSLSLDTLGPRYNHDFNAETNAEKYFDCFLCNKNAVERINENKTRCISQLRKKRTELRQYKDVINKYIDVISSIEDVSEKNINICSNWKGIFSSLCEEEIDYINEQREKKREEYLQAVEKKDYELMHKISSELDGLRYLLDIPEYISLEDREIALLSNQMIVIKGEAGVGKSQLFAVSAKGIIESGGAALLLLGNNYLSEDHINHQTGQMLGIELLFEGVLEKLEAIGIQNNENTYVFIDALNESAYKEIWKVGLSYLEACIKKYPHVKIAVSIRTGYEKLIFNDAFERKIENGDVGIIIHNSLRGSSIDTTFTFLDHYGIPFLPSYFLQSEMKNALFLNLFCKLYSGESFDLFCLFDSLIEKADSEAQYAIGIKEHIPVLRHLINELAEFRLNSGVLPVKQEELFAFEFWNKYGLNDKKIPFISSLTKSGVLIATADNHDESYYLGYNLLEDFVCAKVVVDKYSDKSSFCSYIKNELLLITEGRVENYENIDIAIIAFVIYAEKYHDECFEELIDNVTDDFDKEEIINRYFRTFAWRNGTSINADFFREFINKYRIDPNDVFSVLIENSAKENHPLNAMFLHEILIPKELVTRDYIWTQNINLLTYDDEPLYQLVSYLYEGNELTGLTKENTELLLILFGWILSSSNRTLRDRTSKVMIELLKDNFSLAEKVLRIFETVNDPYVIQRLYGIVFGACVKRNDTSKASFKRLVMYVYNNVFNSGTVYPDILLRDYARLIVERWICEFPKDIEFISVDKIIPPYSSDPIPIVEKEEYYNEDIGYHGFNSIVRSMYMDHSECPGLYGDFGRYIFQSAISRFENLDIVNTYHYAMQFIRDEIGYDDELFGAHDGISLHGRYYRHDTKKLERIGKKYQWIAFYNILARVSDRYQIKDWDDNVHSFEGPWEPYVRDFDPTLNENNLSNKDIPKIEYPLFNNNLLSDSDDISVERIVDWTVEKPASFNGISETLILNDDTGNKWVSLYVHNRTEDIKDEENDSIGIPNGKQMIWFIGEAFFVKLNQYADIKEYVDSERFDHDRFLNHYNVYQLFNREYAWSSGCKNLFANSWQEYEIETGEYRIEKQTLEIPDFSKIEYDEEGKINIPTVRSVVEKQVPEDTKTVEIMHSVLNHLWESQYDASQKETSSFRVPCIDLIEKMKLEQRQADGYYYDDNNTLACFNNSNDAGYDCFLIRSDIIDTYLEENNLKLCWTCIGEKQYFLGDLNQKWSRWNGFYHYETDEVIGDVNKIN